jgi:hypothetical protein
MWFEVKRTGNAGASTIQNWKIGKSGRNRGEFGLAARRIEMVSRQRRWQIAQKAKGNCARCGKPRGENGTAELCERCRKKNNQEQRDRFELRNESIYQNVDV